MLHWIPPRAGVQAEHGEGSVADGLNLTPHSSLSSDPCNVPDLGASLFLTCPDHPVTKGPVPKISKPPHRGPISTPCVQTLQTLRDEPNTASGPRDPLQIGVQDRPILAPLLLDQWASLPALPLQELPVLLLPFEGAGCWHPATLRSWSCD